MKLIQKLMNRSNSYWKRYIVWIALDPPKPEFFFGHFRGHDSPKQLLTNPLGVNKSPEIRGLIRLSQIDL